MPLSGLKSLITLMYPRKHSGGGANALDLWTPSSLSNMLIIWTKLCTPSHIKMLVVVRE